MKIILKSVPNVIYWLQLVCMAFVLGMYIAGHSHKLVGKTYKEFLLMHDQSFDLQVSLAHEVGGFSSCQQAATHNPPQLYTHHNQE